jgi:hypothetical protein
LAGIAGIRIGSRSRWWCRHLPVKLRRILARIWPPIFSVTLLNGVLLVIGSLVLVYLFDVNSPDLFVNSFFFSVLSLTASIISGIGYDLESRNQLQGEGSIDV